MDQEVNRPFICKNTDKFKLVELQLYKLYPKYKNKENVFLVNGKLIDKEKNIDENNIKYGNTIIF